MTPETHTLSPQVTQTIKTSLTPRKPLPEQLRAELTAMRRDPDAFAVVRKVKCSLGCGKQAAHSLTHADCRNAGSWCPTHGWIFFDSVALPPVEADIIRITTVQ